MPTTGRVRWGMPAAVVAAIGSSCSSHKLAGATHGLDLLLGLLGEELGAHHHRHLRDPAGAQHLRVASADDINDGHLAVAAVLVVPEGLLADEGPQALQVDGGLVELLLGLVEVPLAALAKVAGMVLVEPRPLVVEATGVTAAG